VHKKNTHDEHNFKKYKIYIHVSFYHLDGFGRIQTDNGLFFFWTANAIHEP